MEEDGKGAENKGDNVKVALLGSSGVGKTCIIKRYTEDSFDENSVTTAGASYSQKILNVEGKSIQLDLWDTAGQEKYRSLGRRFYKDAYIICLVYDITNATTFEELKNNWYKDLKEFVENDEEQIEGAKKRMNDYIKKDCMICLKSLIGDEKVKKIKMRKDSLIPDHFICIPCYKRYFKKVKITETEEEDGEEENEDETREMLKEK